MKIRPYFHPATWHIACSLLLAGSEKEKSDGRENQNINGGNDGNSGDGGVVCFG
jgi:hypothetical protein